jgi:hypothetical protein
MDVDGGGLLVLVLVLDLNGEKRGRVARRLRLEVEGEELAAIGRDSWIGDRTGMHCSSPLQVKDHLLLFQPSDLFQIKFLQISNHRAL